ncbi:MAG: hypothetical protein Q9N62_00320 [Ghiorsea sp.]|nr:hypothetical protein [Ghiorsea sp.]
MQQHTMKRFDEELDALREHILAMGGLVERAVKKFSSLYVRTE